MIDLEEVVLRPIELSDIEDLYAFRNDWEVIRHLGGFSAGYSRASMEEWVGRHSNRTDEILWAIATPVDQKCIGHVGLYKIDNRVRKAEFAMVIGDRRWWARGLGTKVTRAIVDWGFSELNLHKITLKALKDNLRAIHIYEKLGFQHEGVLRDDQFREGRYLDLVLMAQLEQEWRTQNERA